MPRRRAAVPGGGQQCPGGEQQRPGRQQQRPGAEWCAVELGFVRQLLGTGVDRAERRQHEHRVKRLDQLCEQRAVLNDRGWVEPGRRYVRAGKRTRRLECVERVVERYERDEVVHRHDERVIG